MSHNFHIGQDVVCIKTHSKGIVKEGDVFTVKGLRESTCKCNDIEIHVGIYDTLGYNSYRNSCMICGWQGELTTSNVWWFSNILFAPLDTLTDISEIEEILNQPIEELFKVK